MQLPYSEQLNIEKLGRLFDNKSECYKLFWFKAILEKVTKEGKNVLSYEELVDEMIAEAWYMVTEYHLNLGPKDTLESVVNMIKEKHPEIKNSAEKKDIIDFLKDTTDREILDKKRTLTYNVPYRLQAPFLTDIKGKDWDVAESKLMTKINAVPRLMYYFEALNGLSTVITIQDDWQIYLVKNQEIIQGWIEYNLICYLQKRNPNVPGIADKLYPPQERKLNDIKKYWKLILTVSPVHEIYDNQELNTKDISIDHFVPWSYVAHDEMWNLNPTTKSINSSKSNNLPKWEIYFERLAKLEYKSYELMWKYDFIHDEFMKCAKEHINSNEVKYHLYGPDLSFDVFSKKLENLILPVYQSAENCGFGRWEYKENKSLSL